MASHAEAKSKIQQLREDLMSILAQMRFSHYWGLRLVESVTLLTDLCNQLRVEFAAMKRDFGSLYGEIQELKSRMCPLEAGTGTTPDM